MDEARSSNVSHQSRISAINFLHLRYAVFAADEGSFRRAAEILLVRQSTLSRCIRQLEKARAGAAGADKGSNCSDLGSASTANNSVYSHA
jgi:hypothetical protein